MRRRFRNRFESSMTVIVAPTRDELGKLRGIASTLSDVWSGRILDVGCRSGDFRRTLPDGAWEYFGLDLVSPADVVASLDRGLPFPDDSFETVVALDVLEHTDDIHEGFRELCRVAERYVVVCLPNAYEALARLRFLLGRPLSGKYGLPALKPLDRHRWLFSWLEARAFSRSMSEGCGFQVEFEACLIGPRTKQLVGRSMVGRLPNLLSPWYVGLLRKSAAR